MTVAEARKVLFEQECDALINQEKVQAAAIELAENIGHHLHRRARQGRGQRAGPRGRRLAPGRAARPAADRRGHDGADPLRVRQDRPHPVHRRRRLPPRQAERPDARVAGPVSHPRRAERPDQGRLRPHPDRAQGCADQAVPGAAGDRGRRAGLRATTPSRPWPTTPSRSTRRPRTSAPGGSTRSWNGCSKSSASRPPT